MQEDAEHIFSVAEIDHELKAALRSGFSNIWVRGEVSGLNSSGGGHVYFSLKDQTAVLSAAYFGGLHDMREHQIQEGSCIEAYGSIDVYEKRGTLQLVVRAVRMVGAGELNRKYEELKAKLEGEGLFDLKRKKSIPPLPKCIGLLTSRQAAAYTDFMRILNERFPEMHLRIIPVPVQGEGAGKIIAKAVKYMNQVHGCDVMVITRGGGSIEDLWEFNDECLARAVAESEIPVISAIGHERDFTICDYVADLRAATPTAAAEVVVQGKADMRKAVENVSRHLVNAMQLKIAEILRRWQAVEMSQMFARPDDMFNRHAQRLDTATLQLHSMAKSMIDDLAMQCSQLGVSMKNAIEMDFQNASAQLKKSESMLRALNPRNVLSRGYSILFDAQHHAVRNALSVAPGDDLHAVLAEGEIDVKVERQM